MGQALYRKYRPRSVDEVVGQDHITTTLKNAIKSDNIGHAYLFTGPRGTGKTSVARILAHAVNGLTYEDEATHLDIIEIDAASNRRIDEIRELRERVHITPGSAKYKVYIIDEVHMLTKEAFNALLKTLEEPPAHAIFILATTEAHKLPETIISRTQRFGFKLVEKDKVISHLKSIARLENINIEDEALEMIATHGGGSFRDSIGLLDQVRGIGKKVTPKGIQELLGIPPISVAKEIIALLAAGDKKGLVEKLGQISEQGVLATQVAKQLAQYLRTCLIEDNNILEPSVATDLLKQLIEIPTSHDPSSLLEITLLSTAAPNRAQALHPVAPTSDASAKVAERTDLPDSKVADTPAPAKTQPRPSVVLSEKLWQEALQQLKLKYNTLYSIARIAAPKFSGNELTLIVSFPFHQKRLNEIRNKQIVSDTVGELAGTAVIVRCELDPKYKPTNFYNPRPQLSPNKPDDDALENISNIFGGGEVLE